MYLRVSITDRCNLRCTYCLDEDAQFAPARLASSELQRLMAAIIAAAGVHKIRLTGGEPTLHPDLPAFVRAARWLVPIVGLTTNGVLLEPLLPALREAGLTKLNISLDAAGAEGFARFTRRDRFAAVLGSIRAARRLGFDPLKINAVATTDTDAAALVRFAVEEGVHLRFIELMDIGVVRGTWEQRYRSSDSLMAAIAAGGFELTAAPDRDEPTSRVHTLRGIDPSATTVGFITTVSDPFCATCDRIRLTCQGRFHTCLFDNVGTDLVEFLRRDDEAGLFAAIRTAVAAKVPAGNQREGVMAGIGG